MNELARIPSLIAAAGLLLAGIYEAQNRELSAALFAAGFLMVGVWIVLEVQAHTRKGKKRGNQEGS